MNNTLEKDRLFALIRNQRAVDEKLLREVENGRFVSSSMTKEHVCKIYNRRLEHLSANEENKLKAIKLKEVLDEIASGNEEEVRVTTFEESRPFIIFSDKNCTKLFGVFL